MSSLAVVELHGQIAGTVRVGVGCKGQTAIGCDGGKYETGLHLVTSVTEKVNGWLDSSAGSADMSVAADVVIGAGAIQVFGGVHSAGIGEGGRIVDRGHADVQGLVADQGARRRRCSPGR